MGTLLAASQNPLDLAFVNNQFPIRPLKPPCVAGYEAVAQLDDGTRWYVAAPPSPYGALTQLVPVPDRAASRFRPDSTPRWPPSSGWPASPDG